MEEVVTMDMETIVLIASLISFTMTTALSIAILALCFAYCKVNVHLPILAPIHGSAFPGKTQLHYISEVLDIDNMNISQ